MVDVIASNVLTVNDRSCLLDWRKRFHEKCNLGLHYLVTTTTNETDPLSRGLLSFGLPVTNTLHLATSPLNITKSCWRWRLLPSPPKPG
jgi:hypothetical protein